MSVAVQAVRVVYFADMEFHDFYITGTERTLCTCNYIVNMIVG